MDTFVDSFTFFGHHTGLFWDKTLSHLAISFASIGVAIAIAIPLGVWLGHLHRGSVLAINVSNLGRALPSLAVISIGLGILGIGFWNVLVALVVLAGPVILTNAYVAVDGVDRNAVQAAYAMGMTPRQGLLRGGIPLALPLIFAGGRPPTPYLGAPAPPPTFGGGGGR